MSLPDVLERIINNSHKLSLLTLPAECKADAELVLKALESRRGGAAGPSPSSSDSSSSETQSSGTDASSSSTSSSSSEGVQREGSSSSSQSTQRGSSGFSRTMALRRLHWQNSLVGEIMYAVNLYKVRFCCDVCFDERAWKQKAGTALLLLSTHDKGGQAALLMEHSKPHKNEQADTDCAPTRQITDLSINRCYSL